VKGAGPENRPRARGRPRRAARSRNPPRRAERRAVGPRSRSATRRSWPCSRSSVGCPPGGPCATCATRPTASICSGRL